MFNKLRLRRGTIDQVAYTEIKHRAQIKQLKKDFKTREANVATSQSQLEEESLIIDPGVAYDETRSHRLDVYNEGSPHSKRHRVRWTIDIVYWLPY